MVEFFDTALEIHVDFPIAVEAFRVEVVVLPVSVVVNDGQNVAGLELVATGDANDVRQLKWIK